MKIDSLNKGYLYYVFEINLFVVKKKVNVFFYELLVYLINSYIFKEFNC